MRILIVFLWILTGFTSGVIASDKGHGFGSWILAGLLLGPFGLVAAAGLSDQKLREYIRRTIDPQFMSPIQTNKKLLIDNDHYIDASPNLLSEGQRNFEEQKTIHMVDFLLNKDASEKQIWSKIIDMFEFSNPDLVYLADESKSNTITSISGGKAYVICDSAAQKLALAYSKTCSDIDKLHWKIKVY